MTSAPAISPIETPSAAPVNTAPSTGELASAAVRLVERVAEVAELVRDTPTERVTLKIDLDEAHRVEVRVSMREGRVHAEFRSDSAEVRTALSSAWETFTARPEANSRVWAEPVFASLGAFAAAAPLDPARTPAVAPGAAANAFGQDATGQGSSGREQAGRSRPDADATGAGFFAAARTQVVAKSSSTSRDPHRLLSVQA